LASSLSLSEIQPRPVADTPSIRCWIGIDRFSTWVWTTPGLQYLQWCLVQLPFISMASAPSPVQYLVRSVASASAVFFRDIFKSWHWTPHPFWCFPNLLVT
jgi:hypothetical protein